MAEAGDCPGLAFVIKVGPNDHRVGLVGDYEHSPEQALRGIFTMERVLMPRASGL